MSLEGHEMVSKDFPVDRVGRLSSGFADKGAFEVVRHVFTEFPYINSMTPAELNDLITKLNEREDVKFLQEAIQVESQGYGQEDLEKTAEIMANNLPVNRAKKKVDKLKLDEIMASCIDCSRNFASGNFERGTSLDEVRFRPENVFYAESLGSIFQDGVLVHPQCLGSNVRYEKTARLLLYRENRENPQQLERIVKKIIQGVADEISQKKKTYERYQTIEAYLTDRLGKVFTSIRSSSELDYTEFYNLFEWIFRQNINLKQFGFSADLKESLMKNISSNILPIHGLVSSRWKSLDRIFEKGLEVLYDLRHPEDASRDGGKPRLMADVYGVRIMVNGEQDCYSVIDSIRGMNGFELRDLDNAIRNPRIRGDGPTYRSYDIKITNGVVMYEVQVRTHEMDRIARTAPNLAHDEAWVAQKRERLEQIPFQTRAVFATLIGLPHPRQI